MMTISISAFNRPEYLRQVVDSINANDLSFVERIFVTIDRGDKRGPILGEIGRLRAPVSVLEHALHIGMAANILSSLRMAFESSPLNLHIEDDVIVSTDAVRFTSWAAPQCDIVELFSRNEDPHADPESVHYYGFFNPTGWACSRETFIKWVLPGWDNRLRDPKNQNYFSFGLHRVMQDNQLRALRPKLSRSKHIGIIGTSQTPEYYEQKYKGFNFCSAIHHGGYHIDP